MNTEPAPTIPDLLELSLDICVPATLAALWLDHTNYISLHQSETDTDRWGDLDMIQQDADLIHAHLTAEHFPGDPTACSAYLAQQEKTHIPF